MKLQLNINTIALLLLLIVLLLWWLSSGKAPDEPEPESKTVPFPPSLYPYGRAS